MVVHLFGNDKKIIIFYDFVLNIARIKTTDTILKKPDYENNAYKDVGSIKGFAMLLHDVCPDTYKSLKLENDRSTPPGLESSRSDMDKRARINTQ